jgi:sec-independent protein translocase protein TatA
LFQLLVIALIILVLFGRGKVSALMGDFGKGVKNFRAGLADDDDPARRVRIDGAGGDAGPASGERQPASDQTHS